MNCKVCKTVYMLDHLDLIFWKKCPICAYTEFNEEVYSKRPNICKYASRYQITESACADKEKCNCSIPLNKTT